MNNKNSILLIEPSFDTAAAATATLLVKIGAKSFSYAIVATETRKVIAVYDEQECEDGGKKMTELLGKDPHLDLTYAQVKIAVHSLNNISIPAILYDKDTLPELTKYFSADSGKHLFISEQSHFGFHTIFALPRDIDQTLASKEGKKYQENAGLLNQAQQLNGPSLLLDFNVGVVNAIYLDQNAVVFQQCYEIADAEEFNYYLLLMINQLAMAKNAIVYLSGIIHEDDENYKCLSKYFSSITFLTIAGLDQEILDDLPAHYYSSLLALNECE